MKAGTTQSLCEQVNLPRVTPEMRQYSQTQYALYFVDTLYFLLAMLLILHSGLSARLRDLALKLVRNRFLQTLLYYAGLVLVLFVIRFPLSYYQSYWLEHQFGLSHQNLLAWLQYTCKGRLLSVVIDAPAYAFVFWLMGKSKHWALWLWAASIPVIAASICLQPLVIDPIFNKFSPMTSGTLFAPIKALATRGGIPDASIFVVDKSKDTAKINAYVTGLGSSARIVMWDNTLKLLPEDQILAVVAHEIGHYCLFHIYKGFALSVAALLPLLLLAQRFAPQMVAHSPRRWGINGLTDLSVIPMIALILCLVGFLGDPISNSISRYMEHEADAYGLHLTHNGPAMARAFVSISEQNLSEPDPPPFIEFWLFSHPSLKERIRFACKG